MATVNFKSLIQHVFYVTLRDDTVALIESELRRCIDCIIESETAREYLYERFSSDYGSIATWKEVAERLGRSSSCEYINRMAETTISLLQISKLIDMLQDPVEDEVLLFRLRKYNPQTKCARPSACAKNPGIGKDQGGVRRVCTNYFNASRHTSSGAR